MCVRVRVHGPACACTCSACVCAHAPAVCAASAHALIGRDGRKPCASDDRVPCACGSPSLPWCFVQHVHLLRLLLLMDRRVVCWFQVWLVPLGFHHSFIFVVHRKKGNRIHFLENNLNMTLLYLMHFTCGHV